MSEEEYIRIMNEGRELTIKELSLNILKDLDIIYRKGVTNKEFDDIYKKWENIKL